MSDFIFTNADYDEEKIKASSRLAQSQASDQGFVFVNFDNGNSERQRQVAKRAVRSQATAYSHRVAPRGASKSDLNLRVQRKVEDGESSRRPSLVSSASSDSKTSQNLRKRPKNTPSPGPSPVRVANISRKRKKARVKQESSPDSVRSDRSLSPGAFETYLPNPLAMDASMRDPFATYPVRYRSWFGQLINFVGFTTFRSALVCSNCRLSGTTSFSLGVLVFSKPQEPSSMFTRHGVVGKNSVSQLCFTRRYISPAGFLLLKVSSHSKQHYGLDIRPSKP